MKPAPLHAYAGCVPSGCGRCSSAVESLSLPSSSNRRARGEWPEAERLVFRVGVHLGDVIVDDEDLYGDGVNIAARLEAEAPACGIVISRAVHEAVAGRVRGEIKRCTEIVDSFPKSAAIARLVGAILLEQNDEWAERARCITLERIAPVGDDPIVGLPIAAS